MDAFKINASGGDNGARPVVINAECWMGNNDQRPEHDLTKSSEAVVTYNSPGPVNIGVSIPSRHSNQSVNHDTYSCVYGTKQQIWEYDLIPLGMENETFNEITWPECAIPGCSEKYIVEARNDPGYLDAERGDLIDASNINLQDQSGSVNWNWYPVGNTPEESRNPLIDLN